MLIATFANKMFGVSSNKIYPMSDFQWAGALDTEAQEKIGSKPSTYVKGEALDTLTFEIPLRADFGINGVREQIEEWKAIKAAAVPYPFILGQKPIGKNKWLLKTVSATNTEIDGRGVMLKATLKLEFEEYIRPGKAKPPSSDSAAAPALGPGFDLVSTTYDASEKQQLKRDNPNLTAALIPNRGLLL